MNALRLARIELTRFTTGPLLRRLVPIGLVLLPTLYAAFYLWSNWDPYGRTDQIPVAVVNLDRPVTVTPPGGQAQTVDAGDRLVDQLRKNRQFDWHFVDAERARRGVDDGTYYYSISLPHDFSARLASPLTGQPQRASLTFTLNDANGYIVGKLAEGAEPVLAGQVHQAVQEAYVHGVLAQLPQVKSQLNQAAGGADEIAENLETAATGASELSDGIGQLEGGADELVTGTGQLATGAEQLAAGADSLSAGADELAGGLGTLSGGANQVADGNQELSTALDGAIDAVEANATELADGLRELVRAGAALTGAGDVLLDRAQRHVTELHQLVEAICEPDPSNEPALSKECRQARKESSRAEAAAQQLHRDHDRLSAALTAAGDDPRTGVAYLAEVLHTSSASVTLSQTVTELVARADRGTGALLEHLEQHCDETPDRQCPAARERGERAAAWLDRVSATVRPLDVSVQQLANLAEQAAARFPAAIGQVQQVQQQVAQLATGAGQVADGASQAAANAAELAGGASQLAQGADQAQTGTAQLATGTVQLRDGLAEAQPGAAELASGLPELEEGAGELAGGLHSGADQIPDLDRAARDRLADFLADPAEVRTTHLNDAKLYGRGLAPFFLSIGLWVFGLIAYELLRTVNPRALAGRASAFAAALGGWLPGAILGAIAALVVYLVIDVGLGLDPEHIVGTVALLMLGAGAFVAIIRLLWMWLGAVGGLLALVLLILQLTSAAGTYPIETAPAIFQWLHPLLPMTYLESGLRVTISGGLASHLWRDVLVLAGFMVGALLLSTLVVLRQRAWTMGRLKPAIEL